MRCIECGGHYEATEEQRKKALPFCSDECEKKYWEKP